VADRDAADDPPDLQARVLAAMPSLTPAAARVASFAMDDPTTAAALTVTELAARAGTSDATVVRTARALGFAGYPQLRLALAAAGRPGDPAGDPGPVFAEHIADDDPLPDVVHKLAALESEALRTTAATVDQAALTAAVARIGAAHRVDAYGIGASGLVARDLQQKLSRIGLNSQVHVEEHAALTSAVLLGEDDAVVAISHSGETMSILEPVRRAQERGAATIAITNDASSSLAALADHVLLAAGRESDVRPGAMASRTSQLLLVDCIFVAVGQRLGGPARRALNLTHEAVRTSRQRADVARRSPARRRPRAS